MYKGNENSEIAEYIWYEDLGITALDILYITEICESFTMCIIIQQRSYLSFRFRISRQ